MRCRSSTPIAPVPRSALLRWSPNGWQPRRSPHDRRCHPLTRTARSCPPGRPRHPRDGCSGRHARPARRGSRRPHARRVSGAPMGSGPLPHRDVRRRPRARGHRQPREGHEHRLDAHRRRGPHGDHRKPRGRPHREDGRLGQRDHLRPPHARRGVRRRRAPGSELAYGAVHLGGDRARPRLVCAADVLAHVRGQRLAGHRRADGHPALRVDSGVRARAPARGQGRVGRRLPPCQRLRGHRARQGRVPRVARAVHGRGPPAGSRRPAGGRMRTVILVPRRAHPERDKLWAWAKARWERHFPEFDVVEGHHDDGPFNRSAAINRAAKLAGDWDFAIVIDADIFIRRSQVLAAVETAQRTGKVTWAHMRWRGIRKDWTERILRDRRDFGPEIDGDMDLFVETTNPISWSCCIVFPRAVFDDMGGFDERFRGWGYEDMAVQATVAGLYGHERIAVRPEDRLLPEEYRQLARPADVFHLWHDRSTPGDGRAAKDGGEYTADAITNARLGRRYMVALRRDHELHDRPDLPTSEEERQRDINNLIRDDAALAEKAAKLGLPDWSKWWPTLEELRDGWKAYAEINNGRRITVVVHTGGTPERWEERSAYLRDSLASLAANVTGNIVQRVIYSDWGEDHREELAAIGAEHGF